MAFKLSDVGGYGTGALGDVTNPSGQINSYANVTAIGALGYQVTIGSPATGIYEKFEVGKEIAIHVSATNGTSTETTYLGVKLHCKITAVNSSVLTIDKDLSAVFPIASLANYQVQAITVAQFNKLTLSSGSVTPPAYSTTLKYGGILLAKCADTVTFSGGAINLVNKGIPTASTAYRPQTAQETNGTADANKYSGWENHITARQFLLNCGDGAAMIFAKHYVQAGTASRIGGTAAGVQFTRGTVGGSTIALVCGDMSGFDPSIISKTKGSGQGLGRCYIASNTKLRNDEGLYAYDCISDLSRLVRALNIKNFGDGSLGDVTNPTIPLNNYAKITDVSVDGKTITYVNKTTTGMAAIASGAMVMFHVSKHLDTNDMPLLGKFMVAKVLADDGSKLILDTAVTRIFDTAKLSKYNCQIISVAQFNDFTISNSYNATTAWNDTNKIGGICVIAAEGTCNISGGQINVEGKGGGTAYAREGLAFIGNAQNCDILPLGQGHGSVFLLTKKLTSNSLSRIGATYDGGKFGGTGGANYAGNGITNGGGYSGSNNAGYATTYSPITSSNNAAGSGAAGGVSSGRGGFGGYGSNGSDDYSKVSYAGYTSAYQGSHVFIIADTIVNMLINQISTGGAKAFMSSQYSMSTNNPNGDGGAGYGAGGGGVYNPGSGGDSYGGGSGGYNGGGHYSISGGSSGWAFIYCNTVNNEDTTGVVI